MSDIKLRRAEAIDSGDLFTWINDPETRQASFNSAAISLEQHQDWFDRSMKDPNRLILIAANEKGESIGAVRIDKLNPCVVEFDINMAPIMRGKGYGSALISAVCTRNDFSIQLFLARIKNDNLASIKAFKKAGFIELIDYDDKAKGKVMIMVKKA